MTGFGYGNVRRKQLVTPDHQFRVGSVSKPITAAAILLCKFMIFQLETKIKIKVADKSKLTLDQRVFGPGNSIFGWIIIFLIYNSCLFPGDEFARRKPYGKWVTEITIRHLLEHTSGNLGYIEINNIFQAVGITLIPIQPGWCPQKVHPSWLRKCLPSNRWLCDRERPGFTQTSVINCWAI